MKKLFFLFALLTSAMRLSAQSEVIPDSIRSSPATHIRMVGDFMLDLNLLMPPKLLSFQANWDLLPPDATKDYMQLFQLPSLMVLSETITTIPYYSYYGVGSYFYTPTTLQSATFKLNDNVRLTTYGQYTIEGKRKHDPAAIPWQKNNFMGGMELKFNKNFGVRIEVQQGRNAMFPY